MYVLQIGLALELRLGLGLHYQTLGLSNPRINEPSDCRHGTPVAASALFQAMQHMQLRRGVELARGHKWPKICSQQLKRSRQGTRVNLAGAESLWTRQRWQVIQTKRKIIIEKIQTLQPSKNSPSKSAAKSAATEWSVKLQTWLYLYKSRSKVHCRYYVNISCIMFILHHFLWQPICVDILQS